MKRHPTSLNKMDLVKSILSRLSIFFGRGLHPTNIRFLVGQMMKDYIVLDCHTQTTLIMETTVPTTARDHSMEYSTTELNSSLLLPEFDDKENDPIPVDNLGIYSELDHQRLAGITSLFFKKFPPSLIHYYANPKALKELVLAEAQMSGFNAAIQGVSIVCGKHDPPTRSKKNSDFLPPLKRRKTVSRRCSCTFKISFTLASRLIEGAPLKVIRITDNSNYAHSNGCLPSQNQLMSDKKSAGVYMKNLLEPQLHTILQLVEMRQAPALVLRNLLRPLFPESFPIDSVVISNVRYKARSILAKRKSSTNKEDSGTKSVISFPSDRL